MKKKKNLMSVFSAQTFFIHIKKLIFFSLHKAQFLLICALFSPLFHRNYKRFSKFNKTTQVKKVEFCALGTKSPRAFPQLNRKGARHWASYNMLVPKMCCRVVGWVQAALVVRKFLPKNTENSQKSAFLRPPLTWHGPIEHHYRQFF